MADDLYQRLRHSLLEQHARELRELHERFNQGALERETVVDEPEYEPTFTTKSRKHRRVRRYRPRIKIPRGQIEKMVLGACKQLDGNFTAKEVANNLRALDKTVWKRVKRSNSLSAALCKLTEKHHLVKHQSGDNKSNSYSNMVGSTNGSHPVATSVLNKLED